MTIVKRLIRTGAGPSGGRLALDAIEQNDSLYSSWDDDPSVDDKIDEKYRRFTLRKCAAIIICVVATIVAAGLAITYGPYDISFLEVYQIIWNHILHGAPEDPLEYMKDHVVCNIRMPRVVVAIIAGFGLAVAGAVMQSTLKNPMADSYTTGVSSGAAFGATLSIVAGFTLFSSQVGMLANAFLFSLAPTAIIILVSKLRNVSATSMILAGLAVMYIFNACTTALKLWAEPDALASLYRWQVGSLNNMIWGNVPVMLAVTAVGSAVVLILSNKINILSSGDESAKSLGVNAQNLRIVCLAIVSLVTASIVSFTGTIGFVGLVAPHIVRLFIGSDNRFLIPASGAFGALLLLVSDFIGRTIIAPAVLEVGVITAFIGGPMFLYLIVRQKKEAWRWRSSSNP